jgi:hypothetical protein
MTDQEEFDKARRRLYAIADRMGMRLTIIVRRKNPGYPPKSMLGHSSPLPPKLEKPAQREPGDEG